MPLPLWSWHELAAPPAKAQCRTLFRGLFLVIMKTPISVVGESVRNFFRHPLLYLLSPLIVLGLFDYVFRLLHTYEWDQPFARLICFSALFAGVIYLTKAKTPLFLPRYVYVIELLVWGGLLLSLLWSLGMNQYSHLWNPPDVDIGAITQEAAKILFVHFQNPYQSPLNVLPEPGYEGFKYGPIMILGYLPSAFFPQSGYKMTSALYLLLSLACLGYLSWQRGVVLVRNLATVVFVIALALIPERVGHELFQVGVNDILPVFLLLLSVVFLKRNSDFWAGLFAGLSFSTKFSPALFFIVLLVRKEFRRQFFLGVGAGMLPNLVFLTWDYRSFLRNVFLAHVAKNYDSTSLYSITPRPLHFVLSLIQLGACVGFFARNFYKRLELMELITSFILLLTIIEATYRQVHGNHLIWFIPFLALIFGVNRYNVWSKGVASSKSAN
jgi:hypothetical protein